MLDSVKFIISDSFVGDKTEPPDWLSGNFMLFGVVSGAVLRAVLSSILGVVLGVVLSVVLGVVLGVELGAVLSVTSFIF